MVIKEGVPLGRMYLVETDSIRECRFFNVDVGVSHSKMMIDVVDETGTRLSFLPCALLSPNLDNSPRA